MSIVLALLRRSSRRRRRSPRRTSGPGARARPARGRGCARPRRSWAGRTRRRSTGSAPSARRSSIRIARQSRPPLAALQRLRRRAVRRGLAPAPPGGAASTASCASSQRRALGAPSPRRRRAARARTACRGPSASAARTASRRSATSARLPSMWRGDVGERAPVAGQREPRVERVDHVERVQELADRVGRPAEVEVQRDAPEQVVAGDQQPALGLVQADVRGRVAGRLDHVPVAEVGLDRDAVDAGRGRRAAGPTWPSPCSRRCSAQRRSGSSGTPLWRATSSAPRERRVGILGAGVQVLVARVHPELAAGALGDRARLAAVVDVRVRADEQADVLEPQADLLERALEVRHRARLVHAACRRARSRRPAASAQALQCGTPGHGSGRRRRQTPGQHPLAAADLALRVGLRMVPATVTWRRMAAAPHRASSPTYFDAAHAPRPRRAWPPAGRPTASEQHRRPGRRRRPGGRPRVLRRAVRRVPGLRARPCDRPSPRATRSPCTGARAARSPAPAAFQGIEPTGARIELEGSTC